MLIKNNKKYEILTPDGWSDFSGIQRVFKDSYIRLTTNSGNSIKCTYNHKFKTKFSWIEAKDLNIGTEIETKSGFECVIEIEKLFNKDYFFDALNVSKNNQYYTNDLLSHNCEFLGSSNTLIHPTKLRTLVYRQPIKRNDLGLKIYSEPERGTIYGMVVDTARGVGGDYSAFIVVNVSTFPYRLVATFKNNLISPLVFPNVIQQTAKYYNDAIVLVETNDIGQQVADILYHDLEYEGVLATANNGRAGQSLSGGFAASTHRGVKTTKQVKRIGCSTLKTLVESDKFIIEDYDMIYELSRFSQKGQSYEAEDGHDDLAMCAVLFSWLTTQPYLKELTDIDIRKKIFEQNEQMFEQEMTPFGFYSSGDEYSDNMVNEPIDLSKPRGEFDVVDDRYNMANL